MGNRRYLMLDTDHADARIQPCNAVEGVVPFVEEPIVAERRMKALAAMAEAEAEAQAQE